jgi:DNA-binding GntR family transcriptional regulator
MSSSRPRQARSDAVHREVARNICTAIEADVLRHGDVLPSTRELAEQWNTSVFTISEAMKLLTDEGLVVSKSRSKRVVNAPEQERRNEIRLQKPQVFLIGGHVGNGKSELGRILARQTGWPIVDRS